MKWFKHETRRKAALKRLTMEFGIEGYGLYWLCIELISGDLSIDNLTFELEEDAELIAHEFKMDTLKVEKIMHRCIELGLFDLADNGRLRCLELAKHLDESVSKNHHVKEIKKKVATKLDKYNKNVNKNTEKESTVKSPEQLRKHSDQNRIEENRIEEIKRVDKKRFIPPTYKQIKEYLDENNITNFDIQYFIDYYESVNWCRGKTKITNWKLVIRSWLKKETTFTGKKIKEIKDLYGELENE